MSQTPSAPDTPSAAPALCPETPGPAAGCAADHAVMTAPTPDQTDTGTLTVDSDVNPFVDCAAETPAERAARFVRDVGPLQGAIIRFARTFTHSFPDPDRDAEDIAQMSLQKAYRSFGQFRPGTNLTGWLYTIVRTTVINEVRRRERRVQETLGLDAFEDGDEGRLNAGAGSVAASAEIEALDRIGDPQILEALRALPEERRTVVYLACVEQLSYKEIAEVMGTPVGTVMSRLSRGRSELRAQLGRVAAEMGIIRASVVAAAEAGTS